MAPPRIELGTHELIVLFAAGCWSGSGTCAIIATCAWFLFGASWLSRKFPSGWPFFGALMNLPLWLSFICAGARQFEAFFRGLVACLGFAYLGAFVGRWRSTPKPQINKRVTVLGLSVAIVLLVILFVVVQRPTPIPGDKQASIGQ